MIADIIENSPEKKMTVSEIYQKISIHFTSKTGKETWKNSVRHALSFKKVFKRLKSDDSMSTKHRGCYWSIDEGRREELNSPRRKRNHKPREILNKLAEDREIDRQSYFEIVDFYLNKFYLNNKNN